ncbi:uracil-DNA glycosylase family protein [Halobacterium noricense]|uniref:uracil-DNA glycosylase family protein n=1 Tax=Halobacterium noricense TaxID=223182 RepID=UPI001E57D74B|nr:uracil-DNA glycosylase family protein [Halobacterium noricense]UHH26236.1 uracil-DNA glycosylase [Halobacterium noricense]
MQNVTDRTSNPFGMQPPCESFVPGYGDANADFHVVGDHPGVHGGGDTGVPFTGTPGAERFHGALTAAGLLDDDGEPVELFLSYLHAGVPEGEPTARGYTEMEPFFDAELRAITAHVLLPVGERATRHVLETYTAIVADEVDLAAVHGEELHGSGWLVVPALDPGEWTADEEAAYVDALRDLRATDYHREADLGRFLVGSESYRVR